MSHISTKSPTFCIFPSSITAGRQSNRSLIQGYWPDYILRAPKTPTSSYSTTLQEGRADMSHLPISEPRSNSTQETPHLSVDLEPSVYTNSSSVNTQSLNLSVCQAIAVALSEDIAKRGSTILKMFEDMRGGSLLSSPQFDRIAPNQALSSKYQYLIILEWHRLCMYLPVT